MGKVGAFEVGLGAIMGGRHSITEGPVGRGQDGLGPDSSRDHPGLSVANVSSNPNGVNFNVMIPNINEAMMCESLGDDRQCTRCCTCFFIFFSCLPCEGGINIPILQLSKQVR